MDIKKLRQQAGMSQQTFGDYFNIPVRTIQNWEGGQRKCPEYVERLLVFYLEHTKEEGIG
jgi:DNA-binding transcriptional regulator YiaG